MTSLVLKLYKTKMIRTPFTKAGKKQNKPSYVIFENDMYSS